MAQATAKTSSARRPRRQVVGVVESDGRDKTIRVVIRWQFQHPKYGKFIRRRTRVHAHDEKNEARTGDTVELMECRPVSKQKSWRLLRIVNRAVEASAVQ